MYFFFLGSDPACKDWARPNWSTPFVSLEMTIFNVAPELLTFNNWVSDFIN
jgi:hypothetical protein